MASTSSGELPYGPEAYNLGDYAFSISSSYNSQTGKTTIYAFCVKEQEPNPITGSGSIVVDGEVEIKNWSVEADDTTADVYANYGTPTGDYTANPAWVVVQENTYLGQSKGRGETRNFYKAETGKAIGFFRLGSVESWYGPVLIALTSDEAKYRCNSNLVTPSYSFNYLGEKWYFNSGYHLKNPSSYSTPLIQVSQKFRTNEALFQYVMQQANVSLVYDYENKLVARFALNIEDADPEDWDDPGDYGDPEYTLNLTVEGALSGRHNDPLHDTSYSYMPADQDSVKDYGCGGDGGHGGGGGAGAAAVVVYKFATGQAGSKEETLIAKRHGYGSGGGKGGKGGDGCILIYY